MLFNSLHFLVFFPIVFFAYFALPHRWRNVLLLVASCYFYMAWRPAYILLVLLSVSIDYGAALMMERAASLHRKRWLLALSLASNLTILFVFKYFGLFADLVNRASSVFGGGPMLATLGLVLPLGISFYTFQAMSYAIDVYRGRMPAERSFFRYFLYVMFFPQLVAGPIERAPHLLGQFSERHAFNYQDATDGMKLAAWGLFKKVAIADRLAPFVEYVYADPTSFSGPPLVIATVFFAFQIYCDFSGYSDIAIGTAQMLGFRLMDNFNRPYFSRSVAEFWKRWHISLSTWFKDYVYVPLGGNRVAPWRHQLNLFVTFLVSGLWHGAKWTFVVWGALNGLYLLVSIWTRGARTSFARILGLTAAPRLHAALQICITFFLTCVAWVFFRANGLHDALHVLTAAAKGWPEWFRLVAEGDAETLGRILYLGGTRLSFAIALCLVLFMETVHVIQGHGSIRHMLRGRPWQLRWSLYILLTASIIVFGRFGARDFIYFRF